MRAFGPFVFDPSTGELHRGRELQRLRPQAQQLLALLVSRPGRLVTRDELRAAIARGAAFGAFDQSVNDAIREIRIALADPAATPAYVETLPRRGYRFRARVRELVDQPSGRSSTALVARTRSGPWTWILTAIRSVFDSSTMAARLPRAAAWGRERRSISEP